MMDVGALKGFTPEGLARKFCETGWWWWVVVGAMLVLDIILMHQ